MEKRTNSLIKNTSILGFGTLCTKGIMFFMAPLFTRWLSTSDYGTFDLIVEYTTLFIPILTLSTGEAVFRFLLDKKTEDEREAVISTILTVHFGGIVLSAFLGLILYVFTDLNISVVLAAILYLAMEMLYKYLMMAMRGKKCLDIYTFGNIIFVGGLSIFVSIFVYGLKMGLAGIVLGYAFGDIMANLYVAIKSKIYKEIHIDRVSIDVFKEAIRYSLPMLPNSISWWIVNVSDRTLISLFLGTQFNAIYSIANKIPALCQNFFSVFHLSWQQNAIETLSDADRDSYYNSVMNNMIQIVGSICIFILGINYWFFKILFIEEYFSGYYQSPILVVAIVFSMVAQFYGSVYVARMETKINGVTTTLAALVNLIVNLALIGKIGLYAASVSTLISYVFLFIVRFVDIRKKLNVKFNLKSGYIMTILIYFVVSSYFPYLLLRIVNLCVGTLLFCRLNIGYLKPIITKILKRGRLK